MLDGGWMVVKNVWMEAGWWLKCFIKGSKFSCFKLETTTHCDRTVWAHGEGASRATGYQEQLCLIQPDSS